MKTLEITSEPRLQMYQELITFACHRFSLAMLVVRHELGLSRSAEDTLRGLNPFILEESEKAAWPGTTLLGHTAKIVTLELSTQSAQILKNSVGSLYDWKQPSQPEDLCILRQDRTPWLTTIAHERDAYFSVTDAEEADLRNMLPSVVAITRPVVP